MHDDQPYQDDIFDLLLKGYLVKKTGIELSTASYAFKKVAVVGMLLPDIRRDPFSFSSIYDESHPLLLNGGIPTPLPENLRQDDLNMLKKTFLYFSKAGIPLHQDAQFQIYNLLPPVQSNFLIHSGDLETSTVDFPQADLVLVNFIPKYGATPDMSYYNTDNGFYNLNSNCEFRSEKGAECYISVSPLHRKDGIWPRASFNAGANFIAIHGGVDTEISTLQFENHPQSHIVVCSQDNDTKGQYGNKNMGVVANSNTLETYLPQANKKSALGQALYQSRKIA